MKIGVLALQGDFAEHAAVLDGLEGERLAGGDGSGLLEGPIEAVEVRLPEELAELDGIIIPGGESTTIGKMLSDYGLLEPLRQRIRSGLPAFGTCAGAITLAQTVIGLKQPLLGVMDLLIRRNAYGRQLQSFETELLIPELGEPPLRAVFIRAPRIESVGAGVRVLARLPDGSIVAARELNLLAATFHPELTGDFRLHRYFLQIAAAQNRISTPVR
jgi:5'-phosphate synthase pdxT subunit